MKINFKELILIVLMALLSLILLFSCTAKKTTTERTKTSDTLLIKSFEYVSQPISANYSFELECDSLGMVKPINLQESSGSNQTKLSIRDNILNAQLLTGLSRIKTDTIYKSKIEYEYIDKEVIRYKTPLWMLLTIICLSLVILLLIRFK